jgi:hypothetical protein
MTSIIISLILCLSIIVGIGEARILNVPEEYQTIQAGIDSAEDGDTVLVDPGVYPETVTIRTDNIVLGSLILTTNDPAYIDSTIIDGEERRPCLIVRAEANDNGLVRGFTILNGSNAIEGTGIRTENGTFEDMFVAGCVTEMQINGGAVYVAPGAAATLRRCRIIANGFRDGQRSRRGGGVCVGNLGGIPANAIIEDSEIRDNQANVGGGIYIFQNSVLTARRVLIAGNISAAFAGGAFLNNGSTALFENVTFTDNSPLNDSISVITAWSRNLVLRNTICYGNATPYFGIYGTCDVDYSDIAGGDAVFVIGQGVNFDYGQNNIDADPLFRDAENGDYRLTVDSPCIDTGDPNSPEDPDGSRADMGVFPFQANESPEILRQIDDVVVEEDCGYVVIADLDTVFSDPDGDTLSYSVEVSDQLNLTIDEEGVLGLEPAPNFFGDSLFVVVYACDNEDTVSFYFMVTVNPINDSPLLFHLIAPSDSLVASHDTLLTFVWEQAIDVEGDSLSYFLMFQNDMMDAFPFKVDDTTMTVAVDSIFQLGQEIIWWVAAYDSLHQHLASSIEKFTLFAPLVVSNPKLSAGSFQLFSAFPNPFNSTTRIRFTTGSQAAPTWLAVYGIDGRLVVDLLDRQGRLSYGSGEHSVVWNAEGLPGGIYLIRLESGNEVRTIKTLLMK